jgi:hypothetical protein
LRLLQCVEPSSGECLSVRSSTRESSLATGRLGDRPGCNDTRRAKTWRHTPRSIARQRRRCSQAWIEYQSGARPLPKAAHSGSAAMPWRLRATVSNSARCSLVSIALCMPKDMVPMHAIAMSHWTSCHCPAMGAVACVLWCTAQAIMGSRETIVHFSHRSAFVGNDRLPSSFHSGAISSAPRHRDKTPRVVPGHASPQRLEDQINRHFGRCAHASLCEK